jgi:hypothetical protein
MVKDVTTLHKWLKGLKYQHYTQVVKELKISQF